MCLQIVAVGKQSLSHVQQDVPLEQCNKDVNFPHFAHL